MSEQESDEANRTIARDSEIKVQLEEHQFRHVDQKQRWHHEYERHQAIESRLVALSKFKYEPIDYQAMLVKEPWVDRPVSNFDYLLDEAKSTIEKKYESPIIQRAIALIILLVILIISGNVSAMWVISAIMVAVGTSLYLVLQGKKKALIAAEINAKMEIDRRQLYEQQINDEAKMKHEMAESERVVIIERLLAGELPSIVAKLDVIFRKMEVPFSLEIDIDIFKNIPWVKVWLPPKSIILPQNCELTPAGRVKYEDKSLRNINKQYLELCAALVIRGMSLVYENIPTFSQCYASAFSKESAHSDYDCYINCAFDRQTIATACNATSALIALQTVQGKFESDTNINLLPIDSIRPPEWGEVEIQAIRTMKIKITK